MSKIIKNLYFVKVIKSLVLTSVLGAIDVYGGNIIKKDKKGIKHILNCSKSKKLCSQLTSLNKSNNNESRIDVNDIYELLIENEIEDVEVKSVDFYNSNNGTQF